MTPEQIDGLPDYTDAQFLKLYRYAARSGWAGTTRQIDNQSITFPAPKELWDLIERLERRVGSPDDDGNDGMALAYFTSRT